MKIWKLKAALKAAKMRLKYPVLRVEATNWNNDEHAHICMAARLLNEKNFETVCPIAHLETPEIETNDICEQCPYFGIIDFYTDVIGKKCFKLYIPGCILK